MSRVLVTGATGFLGGALIERLLGHGEKDLRVTARVGSRRDRIEAALARHPGAKIEYVLANLTSRADAERAIEGVSTIYHLAAAMGGAAADMFLNTVVGSKHLLEAVGAKKPMRIVLISSFSVYGVATLPRGAVVTEETPLEPNPQKRDSYAQVKLRQEQLFREYQQKNGFELVVLRPGVIYGPGGGAFSSRVGLSLFGTFLNLGGRNILPLSYVDNCAEAIVLAGQSQQAVGQVYNVHDDDLPRCNQYLDAYRKEVEPIRNLRVPFVALSLLSTAVERYHRWSKGQLPAVFTPYKSATTWGGNRFDNSKVKSLGWRQLVSTQDGMHRTFEYLRATARR